MELTRNRYADSMRWTAASCLKNRGYSRCDGPRDMWDLNERIRSVHRPRAPFWFCGWPLFPLSHICPSHIALEQNQNTTITLFEGGAIHGGCNLFSRKGGSMFSSQSHGGTQ